MRQLACLFIASIALLTPANILAQAEQPASSNQTLQSSNAASINKATPSASSEPSTGGAQASKSAPDSLSFPKAVSYPKLGTRMKVRLNNQQEIAGNLTEVHRDYFVLTDKGIAQKIVQADVVSMKANKSAWQRIKPLLLPFKVVGIAAALPPLGAWLLVSEIVREIRGKSRD
jgi:hypothetical protein